MKTRLKKMSWTLKRKMLVFKNWLREKQVWNKKLTKHRLVENSKNYYNWTFNLLLCNKKNKG